jgi:NAD(P)H-flavin reductase
VPVVTVPVLNVEAITPRSRLVTLDLRGQPLVFDPGQAVMVGRSGDPVRRPYSIACSPEQARDTLRLELLIGVDADATSDFGFATGTALDIEGPIGTFTLPPDASAEWILFVAGGTGIAPLRSMLDHLLRKHRGQRVSLLYSARSGDEFAFIRELEGHVRAGILELHQTVTRDDTKWAGRRGRIGRDHFEAVLHEPADTLCFVCGPSSLVDESVGTLKGLGVPETRIRTESWGK